MPQILYPSIDNSSDKRRKEIDEFGKFFESQFGAPHHKTFSFGKSSELSLDIGSTYHHDVYLDQLSMCLHHNDEAVKTTMGP
jgi:hypothetical protein